MSEPITDLETAVRELGALPMPAGSEPQPDADRAAAPWGRGEDGRPLLPMGAHWTDVPELVDQNLTAIHARVNEAQPGNWYVSPTAEAPGTVCTQYDGYTRTVGRFTNVLPADLEMVLHAHSDVRWCLDLIAKLRCQVAELQAERHTTNEALADVTVALRTPQSPSSPTPVVEEDVTPQVRKLRNLLAGQREAVDGEHYAAVHHRYRLGRDLPPIGGVL
jgi:hypothetical protein